MNILIFYNLLIYLLVRSIGLGIAVDLYYSTKEARFKLPIIGWVGWVIASVSSIYSGFIDDKNIIELFLFLNALFVSLATIILIWWIFTYFLEVPNKIFYLILIVLIILLSLTYFIVDYRIAINLATLLVSIILLSIYIVPLLKWKKFKENLGTALKWFYVFQISLAIYIPISIYITYQGLGYYALYSSYDTSLIILNYIPSILFSIVLIIILIHVEYNFSYNQRFELKDKYSHNLGNILQFIIGYIDIISQKDKLKEKDSSDLQDLIKEKCNEAADLIREIREL